MMLKHEDEKGLQRDTGDQAMHVTRTMVLRAFGESWDVDFLLPYQVDQTLLSEDWDFAEERINGVVEAMMYDYALAGMTMGACLLKIRERLLDALYRRFSERQADAGVKRWLVPASMQDTRPKGGW